MHHRMIVAAAILAATAALLAASMLATCQDDAEDSPEYETLESLNGYIEVGHKYMYSRAQEKVTQLRITSFSGVDIYTDSTFTTKARINDMLSTYDQNGLYVFFIPKQTELRMDISYMLNYKQPSYSMKFYYKVALSNSVTGDPDEHLVVGSQWSFTPVVEVDGCDMAVSGADWISCSEGTLTGIPSCVGTYNVELTVTKVGVKTAKMDFDVTVLSKLEFISSPSGGELSYVG